MKPNAVTHCGVILLCAILLTNPALTPGGGESTSPLKPGDYAVYAFGTCGVPPPPLYPPFFGFEDAADLEDQVHGVAYACPVYLRWEVLSVGEGIAHIRISMDGWTEEGISVGNGSWWIRPDNPLKGKINASLHASHVVDLDLNSMEAYVPLRGDYIGRWPFHIPLGDLATGKTKLAMNWYNGTAVPANVTASTELPLGAQRTLKYYYDVEMFVSSNSGQDVPFPQGLDRYLTVGIGGGWRNLMSILQFYDATSALLLVTVGWHLDDFLFNLYGLIWLSDGRYPSRASPFVTSLELIETNIVSVLDHGTQDTGGGSGGGAGGGGTGGGSGGDDGGDPGIGEAEGGDDHGGPLDGEGQVAPEFPWMAVSLPVAVSLAVLVAVYWRLKLREGRRRDKER